VPDDQEETCEKLDQRHDRSGEALFNEGAKHGNEITPSEHDRRTHNDEANAEHFREKYCELHSWCLLSSLDTQTPTLIARDLLPIASA
jgi:hypothetical protein